MILLYRIFLWLFFYSFVGWLYESIICSIVAKQLINLGFLNGPLCPVYGFGALIVLFFLYGASQNIIALFLSGSVLTCSVEYITSYMLEKAFHARWWDYSKHRFHLHGRVCLLGAVVFGAFSVLLVLYIHPAVEALTLQITDDVVMMVSIILFSFLSVDLLVTIKSILTIMLHTDQFFFKESA